MAVPDRLVRSDVLGHIDEGKGLAGIPPGAGGSRFRIDHHVLGKPGPDQRSQPEQGSGRVAAGVGNQLGARDRLTIQLGQSVDGPIKEFRRAVVPVGLFVVGQLEETEVGRQVDHHQSQTPHLGHHRSCRTVRVGDDPGIGPLDHLAVEFLDLEGDGMSRVDIPQSLPGLGARRHRHQLEPGMLIHQQCGERAGVPGRASD